MKPPEAEFGVLIDFKKGVGNPRRVFDSASLIIEAFERFDEAILQSIDAKIEPVMVLEDVESGSIRLWLRNILNATDDQALKELDWKPQVGKYLVRAKYVMLRWLDSGDDHAIPALSDLTDELRQLARETDVRHLPDYPAPNEAKLIGALDKVQDAKKQLSLGDRVSIEDGIETYEIDTTKIWSPTATITPEGRRETTSHGEMILLIRKPDMIGNTQWQFRHGRTNISAPITDDGWLESYHSGRIDIRPGDALRCWVKFTYHYGAKGDLESQGLEIEKVFEIIRAPRQGDMLSV